MGYNKKREQPKHAQPTPGRTLKAVKSGPHGKIKQTDGSTQASPNPSTHLDGGSGITKTKTAGHPRSTFGKKDKD